MSNTGVSYHCSLRRVCYTCVIIALSVNYSFAQKVGLVLSGGGASGLAHIGVIKALEENHVPIDYITGTSMGAFIGALYAAGYTPEQMEEIVTSPDFQRVAKGTISSKFIYYFKQQIPEASWVSLRFSLDTSIITSIPTHLVSPIPIDLAMLKYFSGPSSAAHGSFDSLMVPFRCVASDIVAKKPYVFKDGNLGEAIRASISYPFYLKPIMIDGKMLFDGGLYNNFPTDVMQNDFHPDVTIGSNVSGNIESPSEDNILSQIKNMLMTPTNYSLNFKGIIIVPDVEAGILTADHPKALIDSGYNATMRQMPAILAMIQHRTDSAQLAAKRQAFLQKQHPLKFKGITIHGLNSAESKYVGSVLRGNKTEISFDQMEKNYYKVATDEDIHSIYPLATYIDSTGCYSFDATVKKEKHFSGSFGGVISNRPISEGYVGLQYSHLGRQEVDVDGNTYFGKLYTSALLSSRIYFPTALPLYIEPALVYNRWDYFTSSTEFFEDIQPPYLIQRDEYGKIDIGMPIGMRSKLVLGVNHNNFTNTYYQSLNPKFLPTDTADETEFDATTSYVRFESNTLNRKEYASAGTRVFLQGDYVDGEEYYHPGSLEVSKQEIIQFHDWGQIKFSFDNYYKQRGLLRLGIYAEGVYSYSIYPKTSFETYFTNYWSTELMAPAFQPTPESQTLFLPNYRAYNYLAGGPKLIISFKPNIDIRFEGYIFQPYQAINLNTTTNLAEYGKPFAIRHYIGVASIVYNSPIGPMALSVNYYDNNQLNVFSNNNNPFNSLSLLFHIGYIIFNERSVN